MTQSIEVKRCKESVAFSVEYVLCDETWQEISPRAYYLARLFISSLGEQFTNMGCCTIIRCSCQDLEGDFFYGCYCCKTLLLKLGLHCSDVSHSELVEASSIVAGCEEVPEGHTGVILEVGAPVNREE